MIESLRWADASNILNRNRMGAIVAFAFFSIIRHQHSLDSTWKLHSLSEIATLFGQAQESIKQAGKAINSLHRLFDQHVRDL